MPKALTDTEREYIKKRLMEEAENCLKLYGVRKTTVDELVKRVNIPKGTFYLFFESKESLFYEVLCSFHDKLQTDLLRKLRELGRTLSVERLTDLLFGLYKDLENSFLYKLILNDDIELLMRKLPPEIASDHAKKDDFIMEQLITVIPGITSDNTKIYSAAMRAIFLAMLHRREIGEEIFEDALKLMLRGVVIQMFGEDAN